MAETLTHPRVGVGVVVRKGAAILLIRRGKPPGLGAWSIPGGRQELGETLFETAIREVAEETGVTIRPTGILTAVDNIERDEQGCLLFHYTIIDVAAEWQAGEPTAGDDALETRWAVPEEWERLIAWEPLKAVLRAAETAMVAGTG